jgi:hypothetical protein
MITIAVASNGTSHENRQPVMTLMSSSIRQKQRKTMMQPNNAMSTSKSTLSLLIRRRARSFDLLTASTSKSLDKPLSLDVSQTLHAAARADVQALHELLGSWRGKTGHRPNQRFDTHARCSLVSAVCQLKELLNGHQAVLKLGLVLSSLNPDLHPLIEGCTPLFGSQFRYHFQYLLILTWNTAANRSQTIGFAF